MGIEQWGELTIRERCGLTPAAADLPTADAPAKETLVHRRAAELNRYVWKIKGRR